jgi:RNA polymerase sigma factor (sigma-70 family)
MLEQWENRQSHPCEANQRYVIAIAVHKVADWYRKGNVQRLCDDGLDEQAGATDDYRNILDGLTIFAAVREVLVRQPAARRAVGVLVFLEGFTYVEAAEALGISQSTVRTHIQRLREQLRPLATQIGEIDQGGEPS